MLNTGISDTQNQSIYALLAFFLTSPVSMLRVLIIIYS